MTEQRHMECYVCGRILIFLHTHGLALSDVICAVCRPRLKIFPTFG